MKKRRKLNIQKTFCTISAGFILACIIFYGYRFITLYLDNKKNLKTEENTLAKEIIDNNSNNENFKNVNNEYYFTNDTDNNYIMYSNILWRIVKVNNDKSIKLISNDNLSYLAFSNDIESFETSYINKWLNNDVLTNEIDKNNLTNDRVCVDNITKANTTKCENYTNNNNFGLLSIIDYVIAGGEDSYLNNNKFFYLSTINDDEVWYVNSRGKLTSSTGDKLYGVRPTITIKANVKYTEGDGTNEKPYIINSDTVFGKYVKINNELWQIYETNNDVVKLSATDYLKEDNTAIEHIYSNKTYYHNDTDYGSLAFYLNQTYINNFSNQDLLLSTSWSNGLLDENLNYKNCLETTIESKIATLSIGNIILNDNLNDYFLMSGNINDKTIVYKIKENGSLDEISVNDEAKIIPTIAISKDKLINGKGTKSEPYEVE